MATEFAHDTELSRYTMHVDGDLVCVVDYSANDSAISLTRTFTVPTFRGKGYAADLVAWTIDDIEKNDTRKIVPMCWYVAEWFSRNEDRAGLLSR